ncbi:MAG: hypothetical protein HZB30_11075 [Nitrospirae bacterium]|nr:hypothetical protein [Nitrospirota bacterium]
MMNRSIHEPSNSVLVTGIYLSDQKNNINHIVEEFRKSADWNIKQKWTSIGTNFQENLSDITAMRLIEGLPKFVLLNKMLGEEKLSDYKHIIICDDDISMPKDFIDRYLYYVNKYDFALAQPARTHNSYIDHHFVEVLDGLNARRTLFVEIGPLFSVRSDIYPNIFPFDETTYMGWGYDYVWPCIIEKLGLRMGIVDATPVEHSMRKPVKYYAYNSAVKTMEDYLSKNSHLLKDDSFRILESYA